MHGRLMHICRKTLAVQIHDEKTSFCCIPQCDQTCWLAKALYCLGMSRAVPYKSWHT